MSKKLLETKYHYSTLPAAVKFPKVLAGIISYPKWHFSVRKQEMWIFSSYESSRWHFTRTNSSFSTQWSPNIWSDKGLTNVKTYNKRMLANWMRRFQLHVWGTAHQKLSYNAIKLNWWRVKRRSFFCLKHVLNGTLNGGNTFKHYGTHIVEIKFSGLVLKPSVEVRTCGPYPRKGTFHLKSNSLKNSTCFPLPSPKVVGSSSEAFQHFNVYPHPNHQVISQMLCRGSFMISSIPLL